MPELTSALPLTMSAATRRAYGAVEQVHLEQLPRPQPGSGQVLIEVGAAGLDRAVLHLLTGTPYVARAAFGIRRPRQPILGFELAGRVVELGAGVSDLAVGDRVFGAAPGSFARYVVARADRLAKTPEGVTDEQAATLAISAGTALIAVQDQGQVGADQQVLVLGASGGVGSFAVQLAVHAGARVTGVASAAKADFVRGLGAHRAVEYRNLSVAQMGGPFDVIIDIAGNRTLRELRSGLTKHGTLVIVGGEEGGPVLGGMQRNLLAQALGLFVPQRLRWFVQRESAELCQRLAQLAQQGAIRPAIDRVVGLDEVSDALTAMAAGQLRGKVVIRPR